MRKEKEAASLNVDELKRVLKRWMLEPDYMQEVLWKTKNPFRSDFLLQAMFLAEDLSYQVAEYKAYPMESTYSLLNTDLVNDLAKYLVDQPLEETLRNLRLFNRLHKEFKERTHVAINSSREIRKDLFYGNWSLEIASYVEFYPELGKEDQKKIKSYLSTLLHARSTPPFLKAFIKQQFENGIIPEVEVPLDFDDEDLNGFGGDDSRLLTRLACSLKVVGHENIITMYIFGYTLPLNPLHSLHDQIQLLDILEMKWDEIDDLQVLSAQASRRILETAAARVILELDGLVEEYHPEELHVIIEKDVDRDWHLYGAVPFSARELRSMGLAILHYIENDVHERGPPYYLHYTPPNKHLTCVECGGDVVPDIIDPLRSFLLQGERIIEINRLFREYKRLELLARVMRKRRPRKRIKNLASRNDPLLAVNLQSRRIGQRGDGNGDGDETVIYTIADSTASIDLYVNVSSFKLKVGKVYHFTGLRLKKNRNGWILVTTPWARATEMPSSFMPSVNVDENMSRVLKR